MDKSLAWAPEQPDYDVSRLLGFILIFLVAGNQQRREAGYHWSPHQEPDPPPH